MQRPFKHRKWISFEEEPTLECLALVLSVTLNAFPEQNHLSYLVFSAMSVWLWMVVLVVWMGDFALSFPLSRRQLRLLNDVSFEVMLDVPFFSQLSTVTVLFSKSGSTTEKTDTD